MSDPTILLEEYRSLREEILQIAQRQFVTLTLVSGALGTLVGIVAADPRLSGHPRPSSLALLYLGFLLLLAAILMMIHLSRQTQRIAAYIRDFLEAQIPELNWETRWQALRSSSRSLVRSRLPLGTSKVFALYLAMLAIGLIAVAVAVGAYRVPWSLPGLAALAGANFLGAYDLYARRSPAWKIDWGRIEPSVSQDQ